VVCPWHSACFNLCTGDIEDAPGLDSLWNFKAEEKDGKVLVSASEKDLKSKVGRVAGKNRPKASASGQEKVVIVGGGSGGIHAVESLRMVSLQLITCITQLTDLERLFRRNHSDLGGELCSH
jgi:hypothetical protein